MNNRTSNVVQLPPPNSKLLAGGNEPPHDGVMEARVAKLEATALHMQSDISDIKQDLRDFRSQTHADLRWLLGAMAAAFLVLLGAIAHGFHWL
jgi:hypothetical protein